MERVNPLESLNVLSTQTQNWFEWGFKRGKIEQTGDRCVKGIVHTTFLEEQLPDACLVLRIIVPVVLLFRKSEQT